MNRAAWTATGLHGLVHALMLIFPQVIVDLRRDLGCSLFELSRAANIGYFAFGLGALPAGWLADRLGSRRVLVGCAAGVGRPGGGGGKSRHAHVRHDGAAQRGVYIRPASRCSARGDTAAAPFHGVGNLEKPLGQR